MPRLSTGKKSIFENYKTAAPKTEFPDKKSAVPKLKIKLNSPRKIELLNNNVKKIIVQNLDKINSYDDSHIPKI
jgi:hypothetical protein